MKIVDVTGHHLCDILWTSGLVHKGTNHVPKAVSERDSDPQFPDFTLCEHKALSNQAFETRKTGRLGS